MAIFYNVTLFSSHSFHLQGRRFLWELQSLDFGRERLVYPCIPVKLRSAGHMDCESKTRCWWSSDCNWCVLSSLQGTGMDGSAWSVILWLFMCISWIKILKHESFNNLPKVKLKLVDLGYQPEDSDSQIHVQTLTHTHTQSCSYLGKQHFQLRTFLIRRSGIHRKSWQCSKCSTFVNKTLFS